MRRTEYAPADEARVIADKLIAHFHPHLFGARIEYAFVSEPPKRLGQPLAGRIRKVTGLYAYLATPGFEGAPEPFYCMELTKPTWDARTLRWRVALVDHELRHAGFDEEADDPGLVGHDEEEFRDIVERHGAWTEGLEIFIDKLINGDPHKRQLIERLLVELEEELTSDVRVTENKAPAKAEKGTAVLDLRRSRN